MTPRRPSIPLTVSTRIFCDGLGAPEGPVLLDDGSWLVVEMEAGRGCVTRLSADGASRRDLVRTGRPNGLALSRGGTIWIAESHPPAAVIEIDLDGREHTRVAEIDGEPMLWCNDLCFGPDGHLYVTDSGLDPSIFEGEGPRPSLTEIDYDGRVYRIHPATGDAEIVDRGLRFANGIAFGPDGALYVSETITGNVYRYAPSAAGAAAPGKRELFGNVLDPQHARGPGFHGPDGMAFSADGRLWVAVLGQGDITVLNDSGEVTERLRTAGAAPTNVAFGPAGSGELYCTQYGGQIEIFAVDADGLPLHG